MADGPFSKAGLGMWGGDTAYASAGMTPPKQKEGDSSEDENSGGILGKMLAGLIGFAKPETASVPGSVAPKATGTMPQQYDLPTAFPQILHQQYMSPYAPAYTPAAAPVAPPNPSSLQGFMKPPQYGAPTAQDMTGFRNNTLQLGTTPAATAQPSTVNDMLWSHTNARY